MGQERQFSSVKIGSTADARRVLAAASGAGTVPTLPPPRFATVSHGFNITTGVNLRVLTKLAANTAKIHVYVWSSVSEKWHFLKELNVTTSNEAFSLEFNIWDGIQLVRADAGTDLLDAWVLIEHAQHTLGAHQVS